MGAKVINTVLNLKDNMSGGLLRTTDNVKKLSKESQRTAKGIAKSFSVMEKKFKSNVASMAKAGVRLTTTAAGIAGAFAFKTGLSEAMDLEGFRTQLDTATKDTKRAGEVMKYAIDLANRTPFEAGDLVPAAASLEMFGLKSERWLPRLGDAAAGVNRSLADVQQGFIKAATTGDFASLRDTLSITKEMVIEYSKKNFGKTFLNSKGQIKDVELLQKSLEGLLDERYKGGMDSLSKTTKGLWSTITGVTKSSLANIMGMQNDGTIKSGSALEEIKVKIGEFADLMVKWQSDGTVDKIADKFGRGFDKICNGAERLVGFIAKNKEGLKTVAIFGGGTLAGFKTVSTVNGLAKTIKDFKILIGGFKKLSKESKIVGKVLKFFPPSTVSVAIMGIVGAGIFLIKNWDKIKIALVVLKDKFISVFDGIKKFASGIWQGISDGWHKWVDNQKKDLEAIKSKFSWLWDKSDVVVDYKVENNKLRASGGKAPRLEGAFANGTSYFRGGWARVNERGGEVVNLPGGSKVIPADKSKSLLSSRKQEIYVTINGVNKSTDEIAGEMVVKIKAALANI